MSEPDQRIAPLLRPGQLWQQVQRTTRDAIESGALQPITTHTEVVWELGLPFVIRCVSSLRRKVAARGTRRAAPPNPFLNPDPRLVVADVPPQHRCLLNKFNVFEHHILVVTRAFERQEALLDVNDFAALLSCMRAGPALAFYNSSPTAGASQPHKHLQLLPLPIDNPAQTPLPLHTAIVSGSLPFRHAVGPFCWSPSKLHGTYLQLLERIGRRTPPSPYNLLLTPEWVLAVPRTREHFAAISLNALAFAGSLLVRETTQLQRLRSAGPLAALTAVSE